MLECVRIGALIRIKRTQVEEYEARQCQSSSNTNGLQVGILDTRTVLDATEKFQRRQAIRSSPSR